jgi:hypothetical protein
MTTSGTNNWFLDNAGIITEAFDRCGIRPTALTREHFFSATRSLNLELQTWSNRGVNLFQIDLQSIPLIQGQAVYTLPSNTVNIIDAYLETYQLGTVVNQAPNFSTTASSTTVTVVQNAHGLLSGNWIAVVVPVAVGGIVITGFYQVTVLDGNTYTIQASSAATGSVSNGGTVPQFTTTAGSPVVTCVLANHGLAPGEQIYIQVQTSVGSIPLFGAYTVGAVTDVNTFTFSAQYNASSNDSEFENTSEVQLQTQALSADPIDRIMTSISRTDYAAQPDKESQGLPTTFWFDRISPIPTITTWQVADGNGPYAFFYYRMRRIQDAAATGGQTPDIPYRFLEALCAGVARRLARKFAPPLYASLKEDADLAWAQAAEEDRERVTLFMVPDTSGYFR